LRSTILAQDDNAQDDDEEDLHAGEVRGGVERRVGYGLVVDFGGVLDDGGGGLGSQVAEVGVEIERVHMMRTVGAGELHATLDALDGVKALHSLECSLFAGQGKERGVRGEGNVRVDMRRFGNGNSYRGDVRKLLSEF
jgi:hypothetical protein